MGLHRARRPGIGLRGPLVLALTAALVAGLGQSLVLGNELVPGLRTPAAPPGAGRTDLISTGLPAAGSPDVSADGRFVAFVADPPDAPGGFAAASTGPVGGPGVYVRELGTGTLTRVAAGPATVRFAAPSVSGDGRLVAYATERGLDPAAPDPDGAGPTLTELTVIDRADPTKVIAHQITGAAGDLPYQRSVACPGAGTDGSDPEAACGPELAADGRTVVFPARLAVPSPRLDLYVLDDGARRDLATDGRALPVLALRSGGEAATTTLHVAVTGPDPLAFGPPELSPGAGFTVVPAGTTCGRGPGVVPPGFTCTIEVSFEPGPRRCDALVRFGTLATTGATAGARTALALVGADTRDGCRPAGGPAAPAPACAPAARPRAERAIEPAAGGPAGAVPLGEVEVGEERLIAIPLTARQNGAADQDQVVELASPGCAITLVQPRDPPPGDPPCRVGMRLVPPLLLATARVRKLARATVAVPDVAGCTAYLRLAPGSVDPQAAALLLRPAGGGAARVLPVAGTGAAEVVLARRDPTGAGDFAAPGTIARVVSVDSAGDPISGGEPSVSADGRYLAFTSPARGPGRQVSLHDTDARGDGSYRPGGTQVVSFLANGNGDPPAWAGAPSLAGNGRSVAFVAQARGAGPTRGDPSACACTGVYVRDVDTGRTYPTADPATAGRNSEAPALSDDGSTLAFRTRPARAGQAAGAVLVRDLGPDRSGSPGRRNDPVLLEVATDDARRPSVDARGALIALQADRALGPERVGDARRVLVRTRYGNAFTRSGAVDFGRQETGSQSRTERITVGNDGPGPVTVGAGVSGPFLIRDGCAGVVLHRGESCVVEVGFAPTDVGPARGSLALSTTSAGGAVTAQDVPVTGLGIAPVLRITPKALLLPRAGLGAFGASLTVSVRNAGTEPVAVTAASSSGEFVVRQGCRVQLDPGGAPCLLQLAFRPGDLGRRTASLAVSWVPSGGRKARAGEQAGGDGRPRALTQVLPMESETVAPTLAFGPSVVPPGRVVTLTGQYFPPGTLVQVEDLDGVPVASGRADGGGLLRVPVLIFGARPLGPWPLRVRIGKQLMLTAPALLIVAGSFQPPDFARRR